MQKLLIGSMFAMGFLAACQTGEEREVIITSGDTASLRAQACVVAVADEQAYGFGLGSAGSGTTTGSDGSGVGSGGSGVGSGGGGDDGTIGLACCTNPSGCTAHTFPPDKCTTMPTVPTATTLTGGFTVSYHGADPVVAYYGGCDGSDTNHCDATNSGFVYQVAATTPYVARQLSATSLEVFPVPAGATAVRAPTGDVVFPLKTSATGYGDPAKPVAIGATTYYLDYQNDCIQDDSGCGQTCSEC